MRLDAVGIVAKNLKESVRFYSLLDLNFGDLKDDDDHVEAKLPSGLRVMIDSEALIRQINPDWIAPQGQRMALAFLCPAPRDVDAAFRLIRDAGFRAHKEPWDAFWGQRYCSVLDPDGNFVDLFAPL
jgi:catechol 2,3-dioxygenase-like lactoylglutathione lyase family enzyme